jgi:two-component system alkaline phosphatase synthesis response regulator PhoP
MADRVSRILVVDDDIDILELLKYNFEREGFEVKTLANSKNTIKVAKKFSPDLVILDIMMPHINGIELCEQIRSIPSFQNIYIFFLTAKTGSGFQDTVLNIGGDDYIEKLMGIRTLMYKVNSVLKKRFIIQKRFSEITIGDLYIHRKTNSVFFKDSKVSVSEAEFELLFFLAQNRHKTISLENIIHNIWGSEVYPFHKTVKLYIENLRKKIGPDIIRVTSSNEYRFGL